ncbi:hypothetical protein [Snodgrassella sp. CFCC 13594]|uniref:hypothetical protein n=1 Tax=Snodgrassella sp. CFCC 13594 TaxID=1775559 RepID=UPI00083380DD|nr:hypothetical protein [Snodgrassella sp. CFCC 13594]
MKLMNAAKKYAPRRVQQAAAGLGLAAMSAMSMAAVGDISDIGTNAATEIAKFAIMISAIGAAVLSVVVLIQGFRMAFGMVKTAR